MSSNYGTTALSRKDLRRLRRRQPKRRALKIVAIVVAALLGVLLLLGVTGIGGAVLSKLGIYDSENYFGAGEGETYVVVRPGQTGADIAETLAEADVVKTARGFVKYLNSEQPDAVFQTGNFQLRKKMSPAAAFAALQDPDNIKELKVTIIEGEVKSGAFQKLSRATGIPVADFEAAAENYRELGVPAEFPGVEGFLFPATYEFTFDDTAATILQKMVDRMWQALAEHKVADKDALRVLTMASLVQREAGSNLADYPKVARVFYNRLAKQMNLESDASVAYGTGRLDTVWTTPEERADKSNKYNTYANAGLPVGPIGLPGDAAIAAALQPAAGDWLYFMPINLETGETRFAETFAEHEKNVEKLAEWCRTHRASGGKRCE